MGTNDDCHIAGAMVQLGIRGKKTFQGVKQGVSQDAVTEIGIYLSRRELENEKYVEEAIQFRITHTLRILSLVGNQSSLPSWAYPQGCQIRTKVNTENLVLWINECRKDQGERCSRNVLTGLNEGPKNLELLDLQSFEVVLAPALCSYAALSYVWGAVRPPNPDVVIVDGRSVRNYNLVQNQLPRTIRDAITLLRELKFQYLWVDALCIDQSNEANKMMQIMQMNKTYNAADLTIVAASGRDGDAGLPGVAATRRLTTQLEASLKSITLVNTLSNEKSLVGETSIIEGSWWNKRAWTYQEKIMSTRCLFFTSYQTYFVCQTSTYCEDHFEPTDTLEGSVLNSIKAYAATHKFRFEKGTLSLAPYADFVNEFSVRKLSNPSDCLHAYSAALNQVASIYGTRIFWGLPEALFDLALCWELEIPPRQKVARDIARCRPDLSSWSWVSISAAVVFSLRMPLHSRCCTWYKERRDGTLVPIETTAGKVQKNYDQPGGTNRQAMEAWHADINSRTSDPTYWCKHGSKADMQYSGLLVFWTTITKLKLQLCKPDEQPKKAGILTYDCIDNDGRVINCSKLVVAETGNLSQNLKEEDFALIGHHSKKAGVLLIRSVNNISYRVSFCKIGISDWDNLDRHWKLLYLR
jgi:hypothetical protein